MLLSIRSAVSISSFSGSPRSNCARLSPTNFVRPPCETTVLSTCQYHHIMSWRHHLRSLLIRMGKRYVSWVKLFGTFVEFVDGGISRSSLPFQFYLFIVDFFFLFFFLRNEGGKGVSGRVYWEERGEDLCCIFVSSSCTVLRSSFCVWLSFFCYVSNTDCWRFEKPWGLAMIYWSDISKLWLRTSQLNGPKVFPRTRILIPDQFSSISTKRNRTQVNSTVGV